MDRHDVQLVDVPTHDPQGESQLTHDPFLMTSPSGHVATQLPLYRAAVEAQEVQLLEVMLQVAHTDAHASQTLVLALATEVLEGQVTTQDVRYK